MNKHIEYNRSTFGVISYDGNEYVLLQNAYLDGLKSDAFFTAAAIRPLDIDDNAERIPVYTVVWSIPEGEEGEDPADLIDWDSASTVSKISAFFYLDDGIVC